VHLSARTFYALLGVYRLRKVEEQRSKLAPRVCPRYRETNEVDAMFCRRCGLALDVKKALETEEKRRRGNELMSRLLEDPELKALVKRKLKTLLSGR